MVLTGSDEGSQGDRSAPSRALLAVANGLALERATADTVEALRARGVRAIAIKGPAQAAWLFGVPRHSSVDVDVLVSPDDLARARECLARRGYRALATTTDDGPRHAETWSRGSGFTVDLHWSLAGCDPKLAWEVLSSSTGTWPHDGSPVEVPDEAGRLLVITLHAARNGRRSERTILELRRALEIGSSDAWTQAAARARLAGGLDAFAGGLGLEEAGRDLADRMGLPAGAADAMTILALATPPDTAMGFAGLSRRRGARAKASYVVAKAFPPAQYLRDTAPLARRGTAGLAAAYAARLARLALAVPSGYLAWRRARAQARTRD